MKINYSRELENIIENLGSKKPMLLLHSCCAPCSSYVLEYLSNHFDITVFYFNPNIFPENEFYKRINEQKKLIDAMGLDIETVDCGYNPNEFFDEVKGLENEPERGKRCKKCFTLRLEKSAKFAKENGFDFFTTTLSISPQKDAQLLNEIGKKLSEKYSIPYLFSDFKKKNGYKRSIELSKIYNLYRQNYCGCVFSKMQTKASEDFS